MKSIQTPDIARTLTRTLELTAPLTLELDEVVQPVFIVGGQATSAVAGALSYSPTATGLGVSPELYACNVGVVANVGVTGAAMLINPTPGTIRVTRVRATHTAAQAWNLAVMQEGHGQVGTIVAPARDTRLLLAELPAVGLAVATAPPAGGRIVDVDTTLATQLAVRFTTEVVLGPGGAAYVRPDATNLIFFAFWEFEVYR